jgi:hypothetical protein
MSDQTSDRGDLLTFIASAVETMRQQMSAMDGRMTALERQMTMMEGRMATKDDLSRMATKDDLSRMATKDDLSRMATKDDVAGLRLDIQQTQNEMATQEDVLTLGGDLARLEGKMEAQFTAVRGDIEQVHLRVEAIDYKLDSRLNQVEGELSRLRSAVYLLAKDRPDVLRLIGHQSS